MLLDGNKFPCTRNTQAILYMWRPSIVLVALVSLSSHYESVLLKWKSLSTLGRSMSMSRRRRKDDDVCECGRWEREDFIDTRDVECIAEGKYPWNVLMGFRIHIEWDVCVCPSAIFGMTLRVWIFRRHKEKFQKQAPAQWKCLNQSARNQTCVKSKRIQSLEYQFGNIPSRLRAHSVALFKFRPLLCLLSMASIQWHHCVCVYVYQKIWARARKVKMTAEIRFLVLNDNEELSRDQKRRELNKSEEGS
jgi:hypothetical protein